MKYYKKVGGKMNSMLNEFLHVGTNTISKKGQIDIHDKKNPLTLKPSGGLWFSDYCSDLYNSWVDFLLERPYLLRFKGGSKSDIYVQPCSIVTLRKDANIFLLNNVDQFSYLLKNYSYDDNKFSYEKLSMDYEGIYVDFWFFLRHGFSKFYDFCLNSLILFDLDAIDYYYSGNVMIDRVEPITWDTPYQIKRDDVKKKVLLHE